MVSKFCYIYMFSVYTFSLLRLKARPYIQTRTSSPLQIPRNSENYESMSLKGLYPIGEGAGYAGGSVSAAVDGLYAGFAVAKDLNLYESGIEAVLGKAQKNTGFVRY
ncbi:hypothetical protein AAC387_Pa03g0300 [Persea americana]